MQTKQLTVTELNIEHLPLVMGLQSKIIANLDKDEKHFILERSVEDFMRALSNGNTHMIGVFDGDKLIAQSMFDFPQAGQNRDLSEFAGETGNEDLVIYKATLVDVDYRGRGLMQKLLAYREAKARAAGKTTAISQIAVDNPASWINALKNGMSIRKVDHDPEDQAKVLYMRKDFYDLPHIPTAAGEGFSMRIGQDIKKEIPALFNKMRYFAARGYYGVGFDRRDNSIVWAKAGGRVENEALNRRIMLLGVQGKTIRI